MVWRYVGVGVLLAVTLLTLTRLQPTEVQHTTVVQAPTADPALALEIKQLRELLAEQQEASKRQAELVAQLKRELASLPAVSAAPSTAVTIGDESDEGEAVKSAQVPSGPAVASYALGARGTAQVVAAEAQALSRCEEADVPILKVLREPCQPGWHGYGCSDKWGLSDSFLPDATRWRTEWNASARSVVNCQRGFFEAFAHRLTLAHWEVEWDAQPFRISAVPPRTIGKMIHQIITANYYHLTLSPREKPPLRQAPLPGWNYAKTTQPGFRWNVLDYGKGNVFSDPIAAGTRCDDTRSAWHCIWQRFPQQVALRTPPPADSALGRAAYELYNISMSGALERSMVQVRRDCRARTRHIPCATASRALHSLWMTTLARPPPTRCRPDVLAQYLIVGGVTQVFAEPTPQVRAYLREHLTVLCHVSGPNCGGKFDEIHTPVAAIHVRRGDSCDRERDEVGPFNSMFAWDEKKGRNERVGFRYCYTWRVYLEQLQMLKRMYGVRTVRRHSYRDMGTRTCRRAHRRARRAFRSRAFVSVLSAPAQVYLATDDADGKVTGRLAQEKGFNWVYLSYPRQQFKKRGWMEFRKDLTDDVPFSLAAALELLGGADVLVGNMGSHVTRMIYNKMVSATSTSVMPPFVSVDGYGLCCDFTEDCSKEDITKRRRPIRDCIHKYGQCTGGDQFFRWRG